MIRGKDACWMNVGMNAGKIVEMIVGMNIEGWNKGCSVRMIKISDNLQNCLMDSSDEDFLPDPERIRKRKEPPDRNQASGSRKMRKPDEADNKQSGLYLHDDFQKGKCAFFLLKVKS